MGNQRAFGKMKIGGVDGIEWMYIGGWIGL